MGNCSWFARLWSSILEELRRQMEGRVISRWDATMVLIGECWVWLWWSGDLWWWKGRCDPKVMTSTLPRKETHSRLQRDMANHISPIVTVGASLDRPDVVLTSHLNIAVQSDIGLSVSTRRGRDEPRPSNGRWRP